MEQLAPQAEACLEGPKNFSPSPDFVWLCEELFKKLDNVQIERKQHYSGSKPVSVRYYEVINNFVNLWRSTVGTDIFPALVLILPYRDKRIYNIKDYTLVKAICRYLKLPKNSVTERRLLRWKKKASRGIRLSDFCVEEIKKRKRESSKKCRITIDKLNEFLDKLAEERGTKGRGYVGVIESTAFKYCLENMSYMELKYLFDIILKSRVIGGQEHKFLNCWHPDAEDYLSVVSDLKLVASKLWDPNFRLKNDDLSVNIGYAFVPHLAKKLSISYDKICKKLAYDFYIEEKMDGERIQLHYQDYGMKLKFYSRRGFDYTYLYGESIKGGTISPFLKLTKNVKECVLDGEMVTFDLERNTVLPFGLVKSSAKNALSPEGICTSGYRPLFMVLDLIYLNGISITKLPLHQRKVYLRQILTPHPNIVNILPYIRCSDSESIKKSLQTAITMGSEGIILKRYNSKYSFGARNDNWLKVKPEYLEQFGENMDLLVIGRTPGKKDSLMCGLAVFEEEEISDAMREMQQIVNLDTDSEDIEEEHERKKKIKGFVSFCVIANGISQEEFKEIDRRTRGFWKKTEEINPPPLLKFGTKVPEEWIEPQNSVVLEIKARSLDNTESSGRKFKAGCTLYGGYCRGIRLDKDWTTAYSLSELYQERRSKSSAYGQSAKQTLLKPKRARKSNIALSIGMKLDDDEAYKRNLDIFRGLYFYILSDCVDIWSKRRITKEQLGAYVVQNGGVLINNLINKHNTESSYRIISSRCTTECNLLAERGYDIINPRWILDCISYETLVKIEPRHCYKVSNDLMKVAKCRADNLGDSYEIFVSQNGLDSLIDFAVSFDNMKEVKFHTDSEIQKIPLFLLSGRVVYVPPIPYSEDEVTNGIIDRIKAFGGKTTQNISSCNLIITPDANAEEKASIIKKIRLELSFLDENSGYPPKIPFIVAGEWLFKSIENGFQLPEEDFGVF
ncbi:hypothetical protein HG535_0G02970 [Zygotorulaspora mrakii]|uniref:DNA ligase n=1 Tax=Zygotorulaspora mrakii TaxID=42260 RepID=A0A7H9B842_ZYGMR|nr:uncharacterized protein HG535_0G02970 [Zygotorulaspora mrakii]QLG74414.1 hypothetical protein HG535_0G02970 [Zygotorulaspora mrakii]